MICWLMDEKMPEWGEDPPAFLNPVEIPGLAAKRFLKRRTEWLHGRWVAKRLLQKSHPACKMRSLSEIVIAYEPGGAPYASISGGEPLPGCLSITHSGPLAASALAFAPHLSVGIDLEKIEVRPAGFFETYFTPSENAYVQRCPPETLPETLTLIWSAKESTLKALRKGLALDTRQVEINLGEAGCADTSGWRPFHAAVKAPTASTPGSNSWAFTGWWQVYQGYILTLAAAGKADQLDQRLGWEIPLQVG
jgi:4'-phosphopantetheinyl transferase